MRQLKVRSSIKGKSTWYEVHFDNQTLYVLNLTSLRHNLHFKFSVPGEIIHNCINAVIDGNDVLIDFPKKEVAS